MAGSSSATLERGYVCARMYAEARLIFPDFEWRSRLLFLARLKEAQDAIGSCEEEASPLLAVPEPVGMYEEVKRETFAIAMEREMHGERRLLGFRESAHIAHSARVQESGRWAQRSTRPADIHHSIRTAQIPEVASNAHDGIRGDVHPEAFSAASDTHVMRTGMEPNSSSSLAMSLNVHIGTCVCLSWERLPTLRVCCAHLTVCIPHTHSCVPGRQHALVHSLGEIADKLGMCIDAGI